MNRAAVPAIVAALAGTPGAASAHLIHFAHRHHHHGQGDGPPAPPAAPAPAPGPAPAPAPLGSGAPEGW